MEELTNLSAMQILKKIDEGSLTSLQVTMHFIGEIERVNPALNAVVIKLYDDALKMAQYADELFEKGKRTGKLHGLPFTIKECFDLKGTPTTLGLIRRKNDIPEITDKYVSALQNQGGIVLGKTNVAQCLAYFESANNLYGVTNNPYSLKHTCGGSSGGEAAIIASGGSPIGLGTDLGGSIRVPAAFCGICGIKPTTERAVDFTRVIENPPKLAFDSAIGILANHAEDLQLFLGIINEVSQSRGNIKPLKDFRDIDIPKLKIGYFLNDGLFEPMLAMNRAVKEAVECLEISGAQVTEFKVPDLAEAEEIFFKTLTADGAPVFIKNLLNDKPMPQGATLLKIVKAPHIIRKAISLMAGFLGQKTLKRIISYFGGRGEDFRKEINNKKAAFIEKYETAMNNSPIGKLDVIISPVCALPAYLHNTADKVGLGGAYALHHNITGFPAGVANVSKVRREEAVGRIVNSDLSIKTASRIEASAEGLPLGIQIAARPWDDHLVISVINFLHGNYKR